MSFYVFTISKRIYSSIVSSSLQEVVAALQSPHIHFQRFLFYYLGTTIELPFSWSCGLLFGLVVWFKKRSPKDLLVFTVHPVSWVALAFERRVQTF